jgi:DivIVA domain-containing protein
MSDRFERPDFATSIRGYDRLQVDDYLDRLVGIAADAEERARTAEAELEFSRHTTIGPRVSEIFDLAVQEAQELRTRVVQETEEMRARLREEAEDTIARARRTAAEAITDAEHDRQRMLDRAEAERDAIMADVERFMEQKAALVGDMERIQEILATATSEATGGQLEAGDRGRRGRRNETRELEPGPEPASTTG